MGWAEAPSQFAQSEDLNVQQVGAAGSLTMASDNWELGARCRMEEYLQQALAVKRW